MCCTRSFSQWITSGKWDEVYAVECAEEKAAVFEDLLSEKFQTHFPEKSVKHREDDKPWLTESIKNLVNQRQKAFTSGDMDTHVQTVT